jgi:hypothetical protein
MAPNDGPSVHAEMHSYERITEELELKEAEKVKLAPLRLKKANIFFVTAFHMLAIYGVLTKLPVVMWSTLLWSRLIIQRNHFLNKFHSFLF